MIPFITLEGGEGAGKSTVAEWLFDLFVNHALLVPCSTVVKTREPGGTEVGKQIRSLLLSPEWHEPLDDLTELLLLAADRREHVVNVIKPALEADKIVICDRFIDSTTAYQGAGRGLPWEQIRRLNGWVTENFRIMPTLTFFLDIPPEQGLARAKDPNRMEALGLPFHERVHGCFKDLNEELDRMHRIDAARPLDDVQYQILEVLRREKILA